VLSLVLGLEKELAAFRSETESLLQYLNDMEDRHDALSCTTFDAVGILGTGVMLLLDRL